MMTIEQLKEKAVFERRYWLKISNSCNNNCLFCLDSDHRYNSDFEPLTTVGKKIRSAAQAGYERLIVSGGEATIHPDFLEIVALGAKSGFKRIQVISNGRMFSYPDFCRKAVNAGLTEVTFSVHGHNAALHDRLSRVNGSFLQCCQGIVNLRRVSNCAISIDIVVNRMNYMHLEDIIRFFSGMQLNEYDLLHIVPFGEAFKNRDQLFFEYEEAAQHLERAFAYGKRDDYFIWTNRFPPHYLEGNEKLIQDPHKLYDEVLGRRDLYEWYYRTRQFYCYPDRCPYCFIREFCELFRYYMNWAEGTESADTVTASGAVDELFRFFSHRKISRTLKIPYSPDTCKAIRDNPDFFSQFETIVFIVEHGDLAAVPEEFAFLPEIHIELDRIPDVFFQQERPAKNVRIMLPLTDATCCIIRDDAAANSRDLQCCRFRVPGWETLSLAMTEYQALADALSRVHPAPVANCAYCISENGYFESRRTVSLDVFGADPGLDLEKLVGHYIRDHYYVKSNRCKTCEKTGVCRGMHINYIRTFGFNVLRPINEPRNPSPSERSLN